jgi:hypothetical protein
MPFVLSVSPALFRGKQSKDADWPASMRWQDERWIAIDPGWAPGPSLAAAGPGGGHP